MIKTKALEKIKIQILCSTIVLENRAVYEITWKDMEETDRPQMAL
jgi:hypothetical protein